METVGIRELRQNASRVIESAEAGTAYRVTNRGIDTGVVIARRDHAGREATSRRPGADPSDVINSGVYDSPKPPDYEHEMLKLVEHGREQSGRIATS
jgi:prevent-host-death family protein